MSRKTTLQDLLRIPRANPFEPALCLFGKNGAAKAQVQFHELVSQPAYIVISVARPEARADLCVFLSPPTPHACFHRHLQGFRVSGSEQSWGEDTKTRRHAEALNVTPRTLAWRSCRSGMVHGGVPAIGVQLGVETVPVPT